MATDIIKNQHLPIYENANIQFNYQKLGTVTLFEMTDEEDAENEVGSITLNMYSTEDPGIAAEAAECLNNPPGITPEKIAAMYNSDTYVDMSACPRSYKGRASTYTSPTQVARNPVYYFNKLLEKQLNGQMPKMLSDANRTKIQDNKAPRVDEDWIKYNPKHAAYIDEELIHHHLEREEISR